MDDESNRMMAIRPRPGQSTASDSIIDRPHGDGGAGEGPRPRKKQRRQRPSHSCAECRRLKMKCDREVPCSNCVRRHRIEFCTKVTTNEIPPRRASDVSAGQQQDTAQVQQPRPPIQSLPSSSPLPIDVGHQPVPQEQLPYQHGPSQSQFSVQAIVSPVGFRRGSGHTPMRNEGNPDEFEGLSFLTPGRQPETTQAVPLLPSDRVSGSWRSNPSGGSFHPGGVNEQSGSHGTLMLGSGGRSKYLGPTAGSEWLKDSETQIVTDSPSATRPPSPKASQSAASLRAGHSTFGTAPIAFPFSTSAAGTSTRDLLSHLPPRDEAWTLAESYYRYCAWHHDVAPKPMFKKMFDRVYKLSEGGSLSPRVNPQEIALVFIIMAQGTLYNIEMPNYDPSAEDWLHLSERALVEGNFLSNNMVAGLQTLHLMAHMHLQLDKGDRGDIAWPLWGLVMRLVQAMGMHRDGACWNLPHDVVEERRKVFWECNAADTFQAHCFSRPCAVNPDHCDVVFPSEPPNASGEKSYSILRFELSQLSSEILNMAMKVRRPAYSDVIDLDLRLCEFERNLPFSLRCRVALLSMPSRYPQFEAAIAASPEPSRRSMTISFQQSNLALNISETIINLHRPYYAKALYEEIDDRVKSVYAPSFLTVIERCAMIIALVNDIHTRFPAVSTRQWNFWYHVFGSALCLGTLVLRDPSNPMGAFVLSQIDAAINLFTSLIRNGANTPRYNRNLQWLMKLRVRASSKISKASTPQQQANSNPQRDGDHDHDHDHDHNSERHRSREEREESEDVELLGWRTRLIERAGQNHQTIRTIHLAPTPNGSHITNIPNSSPGGTRLEGLHGGDTAGGDFRSPDLTMPSSSFPWVTPDSTDGFLNDFWDPMLLQDIFGPPHG